MDIVPITVEHANAYLDILKRTTAEERYYRFFGAIAGFTLANTAAYVTPAPKMLGFIALEKTLPLGAVHAIIDEDQVAELFIVVAHDSRRKGVGRALITRLLETCGKQRIVANIVSENIAMRTFAYEMGFHTVGSPVSIVSMVKEPG